MCCFFFFLSSLGNVYLDLPPIFWLGCFLILSCMSCLYILEINSLSVTLFANIFSHSKGCLFVLFTASFAVQKLLSLIRSHSFIFIFITLGGGSKKILWCMSKSVLPMFSSKSFMVVGPLHLNDLFSSYFSLSCEGFLLFVLPTSSLAPFNTVLYLLVRTITLKSEHNTSKSLNDSTNALHLSCLFIVVTFLSISLVNSHRSFETQFMCCLRSYHQNTSWYFYILFSVLHIYLHFIFCFFPTYKYLT